MGQVAFSLAHADMQHWDNWDLGIYHICTNTYESVRTTFYLAYYSYSLILYWSSSTMKYILNNLDRASQRVDVHDW